MPAFSSCRLAQSCPFNHSQTGKGAYAFVHRCSVVATGTRVHAGSDGARARELRAAPCSLWRGRPLLPHRLRRLPNLPSRTRSRRSICRFVAARECFQERLVAPHASGRYDRVETAPAGSGLDGLRRQCTPRLGAGSANVPRGNHDRAHRVRAVAHRFCRQQRPDPIATAGSDRLRRAGSARPGHIGEALRGTMPDGR